MKTKINGKFLTTVVIDRVATRQFRAGSELSKYLSLPALPPVGTRLRVEGMPHMQRVVEIAYSEVLDQRGYYLHCESSVDVEGQTFRGWNLGSSPHSVHSHHHNHHEQDTADNAAETSKIQQRSFDEVERVTSEQVAIEQKAQANSVEFSFELPSVNQLVNSDDISACERMRKICERNVHVEDRDKWFIPPEDQKFFIAIGWSINPKYSNRDPHPNLYRELRYARLRMTLEPQAGTEESREEIA